jgi:hypothetical protein
MGKGKITKLTDQQWETIPGHIKKWVNHCVEPVDYGETCSVITEMYERMGHKPPLVLIAPSPMAIPLWLTRVTPQLGSQLGSQLHSQLGSQFHSQLRSQLVSQFHPQFHSQLYSQVGSQLVSQLDSQFGSQLRSQLVSQTRSQLRSQLVPQLRSQLVSQFFVVAWWMAWAGWYEFMPSIGVDLDVEKMRIFTTFCRQVMAILPLKHVAITCEHPTVIEWQDGLLHNETGPSVRWPDGWSLWSIRGVAVNEQIVMAPETQTIEQINAEPNAEVKRIRIERFGWPQYLEQSSAVVVDEFTNEITQTDEVLMRCQDIVVLVAACPSTARVYAMEVDPSCSTVEQAQNYLQGGRPLRLIGAS